MDEAHITLVIPNKIRPLYPSDTNIAILSFAEFIGSLRKVFEP